MEPAKHLDIQLYIGGAAAVAADGSGVPFTFANSLVKLPEALRVEDTDTLSVRHSRQTMASADTQTIRQALKDRLCALGPLGAVEDPSLLRVTRLDVHREVLFAPLQMRMPALYLTWTPHSRVPCSALTR